MEWAESIAFGPLALKPWEFGRLQPHEFYELIDGYKLRQERQEDTFAYFTCYLMNTQLKTPITPKKLLEPLRQDKIQQKKNEDEEYLSERFKAVLGVKKIRRWGSP